MSDPLKLFVRDGESLNVLSACLQDAIVPLGDIAYLREEQRFVLVVNRFKWEDCEDECLTGSAREDGEAGFERTLCGICFDGVRSVKTKQVDLSRRDQILSLLAVEQFDRYVDLHFCGGEAIRLEVDDVRCRADDMGEAWPTQRRPQHPVQDIGDASAA